MDRRVEHGDDLVVELHGPRNENGVLVHLDHALGETRLTRSRRAVQEDRALRHERWAEIVKESRRDHQVCERLTKCRRGDWRATLLGFDDGGVVVERDRRRAGIGTCCSTRQCLGLALVRGRKDVVTAIHALNFQVHALPQRVDGSVDDAD